MAPVARSLSHWLHRPRPMRDSIRAIALLAACLSATALPAKQPQGTALGDFSAFSVGSPQTGLALKPLTITTAAGRTHSYTVELAETSQQQAIGMMFRKDMARNRGMLFPMRPPREASFYMRNTYVPLDIIFIGPDRRVLNIGANAVPLSEALVSSTGPVSAVLELRAGEAARIGLKPGDKVSW
jgi:uncharacterized protein